MKKFLIVLVLVLILVSIPLLLISCGGTPFLQGKVWADKEVLTYKILRSKDEQGATFEVIGEMEVTIETLSAGFHSITGHENKFALGKDATKIVKIAKDLNDNVIMHSESLLDGFTSKASYKKVNYKSSSYEVSARYSGSNYYISRDGGKEKKIKIKKGFLDNEIIYEFLRCQELSRNYSTKVTVVDINSGIQESISLAIKGTSTYNNGFEYNDLNGTIQPTKLPVKTYVAYVSKTTAPIGTPIEVQYAQKDSFLLNVGGGRNSYYPVVKIVEDDIVYELTKIQLGY